MAKGKGKKRTPAQKAAFSRAREAAIRLGWKPFKEMSADQKKAFRSALKGSGGEARTVAAKGRWFEGAYQEGFGYA